MLKWFLPLQLKHTAFHSSYIPSRLQHHYQYIQITINTLTKLLLITHRHTLISHHSFTLPACFKKLWMVKYVSLCVIRWLINRSKGGVFILPLTHTQIHICMIPHTHFPFKFSTEIQGEMCSQAQALLPLSYWLCLASFFSVWQNKKEKKTREEYTKPYPGYPVGPVLPL